MRVLITGSAGVVGTVLVRGLKERHDVRGFDLSPTPGLDDFIVGDVGDEEAVLDAMEGMEAVIHLTNGRGKWQDCLENVSAVQNVLEAARHQGVRRMAYASRAGVHPRALVPRTVQRTVDLLTRPHNFYTLSKVYAEQLGHVYVTRYDMEFVSVRIGNFKADRDMPSHPHHLSHGDCVRCFEQAITHPNVGFQIVFGVSDSDRGMYDLDHGRRAIGYYPRDKSQ